MRSLILSISILLTATLIVSAQSDDCTTATMLGAADLMDGIQTAGATTADNTASGFWGVPAPLMDLTCDGTNTFTIDEWWRFDVVSGNDITIDIGGATTPMVAILEASTANCGTPNMNTFLGCMDASLTASMTFENCFMAGGTYYIVVLTDVANQGAYDITVTEGGGTSASALGDNCMTAISLDPVVDGTDGTTITCGGNNVSGTTLNNFQEAKNDNLPQAPCIEANEATTWYSFTAGDDLYIENTISTDLSVAVYSGVCGGLTLEGTCDNTGNIQLEDVLIPGNIYYIQVAFPYGSDGTFDICVNSPLLPTPDDCATAEVLAMTNGVTTSAVQMDNLGATSTGESFTPGLIAACGTGSFSTVYYQFTLTDPNTHVNINYTETGATPIDNSQITILEDCSSLAAFNMYEWTGDTDEDICLAAGTYYIQIASCDIDEGTFTLDVTPNTPPSNDECANAIEFNDPNTALPVTIVPPVCEVYSVSGTTEFACPEATALGSTCDFDTESTVWYTFTTNANPTQEAEITLTPTGVNQITSGTFALLTGPCDGTIVGTCQTDLTEANITLTPNTQYYIAVSQDATIGTTGTFDLEIEISSTPTNDECDLMTNPILVDGTMGTTICADGEIDFCMMPTTADHQVFYQYTNNTGANVDLTVTFNPDMTNGIEASDISMIVLEDDCSTFTVFNGTTAADYCNILSTPQNIDCIENGETIIIAVGSPDDGSQGEFTVTLVENTAQPTDNNDECVDALPIFDPTVDNTCEWITINGTTADACPEDFTVAGCDYGIDPVVWYSFTAPTSVNPLTIELQNLSGTGTLYATIFEMTADCDIQTVLSGAGCDSGIGPFGPYDIVSGTTYLIGVGDDMEGAHSFDIKVNELPDNNDCDLATNPNILTATMGTTACATGDFDFCTQTAVNDHHVFYQYTNNTGGNVDLEITLTGDASNGNAATDLSMVVFEDNCSAFTLFEGTTAADYCNIINNMQTIDCIEDGVTIIIMIGSPDLSEGDFTIVTNENTTQPLDNNDECLDALLIFDPTVDNTCEWITINGSTAEACPEDFTVGACAYDEDPVVWYSFTAPTSTNPLTVEIQNLAGVGTLYGTIFEMTADCDMQTVLAGAGCDSGTGPFGPYDIVSGTTYLIGIGDTGGEGAHSFDIKVNELPDNNDCDLATNPNILTATMGTTACATGDFDFCAQTAANDHQVFYQYTNNTGGNVDLEITLAGDASNGNAATDLSMVVFEDNCSAFALFEGTTAADYCNIINNMQSIDCIEDGVTIIIMIGSPDLNEGDFTITTNENTTQPVDNNDECTTALDITPANTCEWVEIMGSTVDACPEDFTVGACAYDMDPVVWYTFTAPVSANPLTVELQDIFGGGTLYATIFEMTVDCDIQTVLAGAGCDSGAGPFGPYDIVSGTTYLIGVGDTGGEGAHSFEIKINEAPANDDPCAPEVIATTGDVNTTTMGTTICATMDLDEPTCGNQDENSVWYEYTIPAGTTGFIVTLTNTGTGQDFAVGVYDFPNGCLMNPVLLDADVPHDCSLDDGGELKFTCLDEGTTAYIMVSTLDAEAGDFDLIIDPIVPDPLCIDNDLCDMADNASPIATPITDGGQVCVADCNLDACPENFFAGACAYNEFPTVFYTVTTDANAEDATMTVILSSADGNPFFSVLEFDCANPTAVTAESLCVEGNGASANLSNMEVDANTTYIIAVALDEIDAEGGDFELCVNVTTSCNDDPCSPYPLVNGDGVGTIALDCDNNIGSTSEPFDYVSADCDDPLLFASTVYFSYTVPDNVSSFTLFYTNDPVNGIQNAVGINIMVYDAANCAFQQVEVVDQQCIQPNNTEPMEIDCPASGDTYLIQITSAAGDEGEFDILITETLQTDPCAANDDCDFAMELDVSETCVWLDFADCNIQACPEAFSDPGGMCAFDASAVVWYTFTTPPNAVSAGIELVPGLVTDPTWALLIDNGCANPPTALNNDVLCVTVGGGGTAIEEDITIEENTTYYLVVGSESGIEGDFTLNIKIDVPPLNDDPCINDDNPPLDLTGGGSHTGTTCCARGPKDENPDGTLADFENVDCSAATEDAAVWYMYTTSPDDDGYEIILESGGADPSEGPIAIEVYAGPADQGCNGGFGQTLASSCAEFGVNFSIGNCFEPGEVLFVKVSTDDADENCGEFILTIIPASCAAGQAADDCIDLVDETPIEPITPPNFDIEYFCVQGCLDYACPEDDAMGGCGEFVQNPTVWFQVTADDLAAQMFSYVTPNGNWSAVWSVYSGPDCDNLSVVNFGGSPPCSNGDDTPDLHQTSVFDDEENYWIAVTVDPNSIPSTGLEDGSFELCVATTINAIICLGELEGGACDDESLVMEITDREIEDQPLTGPFCQGEEVTINISFFYDASESGADWLIGFVPVFGNGWDLENFDYAANAPTGNGQTAQWYEEDGDCAPILQEPNPILCTYTDADGNLQLCNLLCSPCSECPVPEMLEGDPLPSGYFWVSNGGNAGCDNDCSPGEGWGIGSTMAQIDWTFTLNVKEFDSFEDCLENNDLSISFQTFSDGTGGCWEDPVGECLLDRAMFSPAWEVECEAPPAVEGPDEELCHDGVTDIFVQTVDGSTNTIIVEVEDNPFVTGENNYTFPGGTGTIQDDLLNETNDIQIVIYNVYSEDPSLPCPGVVNQIEVTIYPELVATFPPTFICEGECADITPDIFGGIGAPYTYNWSTGENTAIINVCPVVPTTYSVTVEDALGCTDVAEVQVDVKPPVELMLPESIDVCKDDNFDPFNPDYIVCLDFISGSSPFGITWNAPPGLSGSPGGAFGECFIINELLSSEFVNDGVYTLSVTVVDFFGCQGETEMTVNITGELILVVDVLDLECGDTQAIINATGFDAVGDPVTTFLLYGGCPANGLGDFLEECFNTSGVCTFPPVDLLDYTCYTIVAQTESGCQSTLDIEIPLTEGTPIDITGTPAVCLGEEATITINNSSDFTTFVWTPNIGSTGSVTFTPDSTATYFVEATDVNGCNSQAVFNVAVNAAPTISLSGSTTFCDGGTASVTASGGLIYDWTSPTISGFPTSGATITVGEPGEVTLMMTDANGCSSDTTITFTQEDVITISLGDVNICDGMGDTVFVSNEFINIEWYDDTPTLVSDTTFYVITGAGTFTVQANDGATGCDANGSFEVMDFMTPQISVSDTVEVCRIDSGIDSLCVDFSAQVTGSGGTWQQDTPIPGFMVDLSDLTDVCFEGAQTGCYAFTYTTNGAQAPCMNVSETMTVCVKACPCPSPATQAIDPICNIGTTNLALAEVTSDPGTWSVESGPMGQDITGILTGTIFNASGILAGDYVVRFTLDNPGQPPACEQFSEQTITVFARPEVTGMNGVMCNIDNGTDPTVLDLFDLISVDGSDGGSWVQVMDGAQMVTITGGSTIMSSDLSTFPETLTFEYTSSVEMGSPCPPAVVTVEVLVRDCNCPFVDVLPTTLCNNGGLIDLNDLLINPDGLAGTWSTTGTLVGSDMFDPNGLPSGLYTITYTLDVSPGPTCDIAYTDEILIRRQSVAEPATATPPCSVDTGNGPTTTNLYDWLEAGYSSGGWSQTGGTMLPFTDNGLDMAVVDFNGQDVGSMFVFTFTTNDAQDPCTNVSVEVTITVVDCNCPPIVLAPATDLCNLDGMLDLCALSAGSDPGTFTVMSIGGTDFSDRISADGCTFDATGLNPGEFVITFTLDQMVTGICEQSLQENFNVVQYLTSTIQDPPEVCSDPDGNGLMSLNFTTYVSNAGVGMWEDTDGAGVAIGTLPELQNVSFVNVPAGVYTFTYTIDNDEPCADVVLTMEVSVTDDCNCPSIIPLNPDTECNTDGPIDLTQYDDPMRPGTWSSSDLTVENGNSLVIDGVIAGTYFLVYTIDDIVPDCDSTAVVEITIGEPGNAGVPSEPFRLCEGDQEVIDLSTLLDGEDDLGVWTETSTNGSVGFDGTNVFTTDNDVAGTYTFTYTLSNNAPCPDISSTVSVVIAPNPVSDAGEEKFIDCTTTVASLGGNGTSTGAEYEYTWIDTATGEEVGNTETIDVTDAGTYELTVLNTETGCTAVSSVEVEKSDDLPTMDIEVMNITCNGDDDGGLLITNQSGGDGNYTYTLGAVITTDPNDFATLPAGMYVIEIMDGIGCAQSYEFEILEPAPLVVNAGPDIVGDLGETFDLTIEPFNTEGIASLIWTNFSTADTLCNGIECTSITVTPTENPTTYYVEAIDSNGCVAFDEVQIQLQQIVDVIFPNIISPNGDNTNDVFYIKSGDVETVISMKIFDRWGEKVFDAGNFPPRDPSFGWDGKFKEQAVVPGVYVFTVEVLFVNGDTETFSGDVTVTDSE